MLRIAATWRGPRDTDSYASACWDSMPTPHAERALAAAAARPRAWTDQLADGSLVVVAVRPGRWLRCYTTTGALRRAIVLDAAPRHFTGHAIASPTADCCSPVKPIRATTAAYIGVRGRATFENWRPGPAAASSRMT